MINTRPLVGCLENSDQKLKQFRVIPRIASSRLVYCSSIQGPNLNVSTSFRGSLILAPPGARELSSLALGCGKMRDPGNEVVNVSGSAT